MEQDRRVSEDAAVRPGARGSRAGGGLLTVALLLSGLFVADCSSGSQARRPTGRIAPQRSAGVVATAQRYIGTPYRFGGKSPRTGFDCSGFTRFVIWQHGRLIPVGAKNQFRRLRPVRVPRPGDLVFFRTRGRSISHVGIYVGGFRFLHAPRSGRRVGYADIRTKYWRKRYAGARAAF